MSEGKRILDEAIAELGVTHAVGTADCTFDSFKRSRDKHDPQVVSIPPIGPTMLGEGDGILAITINDEPAILIVDRGSEERPPLALFQCPSAKQMREIGAFCLQAADRLDGGAGKQ